ncbi:hypothetical protein ES288_D13G272100v1 [Gossypium darwinii]|uniref:Uncharacterized protein n=1 Tax=Gossypium darwinii TaxID=34276 RepID=A0A5D2A5T2_GOSDA|nr:hypothetical protein ES288_D13G272100v1 [Gossypium darwinii]
MLISIVHPSAVQRIVPRISVFLLVEIIGKIWLRVRIVIVHVVIKIVYLQVTETLALWFQIVIVRPLTQIQFLMMMKGLSLTHREKRRMAPLFSLAKLMKMVRENLLMQNRDLMFSQSNQKPSKVL